MADPLDKLTIRGFKSIRELQDFELKINDNSTTAPSKRLEGLSDRFKKTSTGIAIAKGIGIPKMR